MKLGKMFAVFFALACNVAPAFSQIRTIGGPDVLGTLRITTLDSLKATLFWAANGSATAPSISFLNSRGLGLYRLGADTLGFAAAGGLAFRMTNGVFQGPVGSAGSPTFSFSGDDNLGLFRFGTDTLAVATGGVATLRILGGSGATILGSNAGNMNIIAGTGNSRTMTLQTTTSAGTAKNTLVLGADSSATFLGKLIIADTIRTSGKIRATALTASSGTPNVVCIDATTKEFTENAASTCVVSSQRFKRNIMSLSTSWAQRIVDMLQPVTFTYRDGGRAAIGLIAEQADTVDRRLVSYDKQRRPHSINYEQVTVALLAVVKQQQRSIDSLRMQMRTLLGTPR